MKKTFKKAIAVALAGLMVATSVPFTALAAPGDAQPVKTIDIDMQFNNYYNGGANGDNAFNTYPTLADKSQDNADCYVGGLYGFPITYDKKNGTMVLPASKTEGTLTKDYTYGVGDYFTATVIAKNMTTIGMANFDIAFSSNVEPAGLYTKTQTVAGKKKTYYYMASVSEGTGDPVIGGKKPIASFSGSSFYKGFNTSAAGDMSAIQSDADGNQFIHANIVCAGNTTACGYDISSMGFNNPETGAYADYNEATDTSTGYSYDGQTIICTFLFKITAEGAINFDVRDKFNTIDGSQGYMFAVVDKSEGNAIKDYYTYAINADAEGNEYPGSRKITFMGTNENISTPPCEHANTTVVAQEGKAPTCGADGLGNEVCDDCGAIVKENVPMPATGEHSFTTKASANKATDATCTAAATYYVQCDNCDAVSDTLTVAVGNPNGHSYTGTAVAVTATTHKLACANGCGEYGEPVACTFATTGTVTKQPTCTTKGETTYACTADGCTNTLTVADINTINHSFTTKASANKATDATCTAAATYYVQCDNCDAVSNTVTVAVGNPNNHSFTTKASATKATDATCTAAATYYVQCDNCDAVSDTVTVAVGNPNNHSFTTKASANKATDATCTAAATYYVQCDNCDAVSDTVTVAVGNPNSHSFTTKASATKATDATCTAAATYYVQCDNCDAVSDTETVAVGDPAPHSYTVEVEGTYKAPTKIDAGKEADKKCATCDDVKTGAPIPALGFTVKVEATNGTATINGEAVDSAKIANNAYVTVKAEPAPGYKFVGWVANNGTTVSTNAEYTALVNADITYTAVFAEVSDPDANTITVTFVDVYGNIVDTKTITVGSDIADAPAVPARAGYTAKGWSVTDFKALNKDTTVTPVYEKDVKTFTVTATGCQITVNGVTVADTFADIPYDTQVTVKYAGADAWEINGTTVAYGETYTFYVGANVTLTHVENDTITAKPTVANVGVNYNDTTNRVSILATRSLEGFGLINAGFIFGVDTVTDETTLVDVDGTNVKAIYCKTSAEQFSLSYGKKNNGKNVTARAFITYDNNGEAKTIYADLVTSAY